MEKVAYYFDITFLSIKQAMENYILVEEDDMIDKATLFPLTHIRVSLKPLVSHQSI
jgi:hypothetical protein